MADIQHVVNVSGGKDSTAVYLRAIESGRPFRAVMADTGNEHEATHEYVARLHERTGGPQVEVVRADFSRQLATHRAYILRVWPTQGIPQHVVDEAARLNEPTGNPFLDLCVSKGRFPSRKGQFCTDDLKTTPIIDQVVLPMLAQGPVLQWLGIRAEESAKRAEQPLWNHHEAGSTLWRPIFSWTVEDVWAIHRRHALRPNPLYAMGAGRVGCWPCVNCRKDELRLIADVTPEHIERLERWEAVVAAANKHRMATFFAPINGDILPIRNVIEWARTGRGGRQFDIFMQQQAGGGCTSDLGLCERSAA
ncbi:3'-phosphoadenosine 5'-phosphosulfate sulfotransferase (PAPS reductase)/FAD synthetase [Luteibacter sp. 1214]|uniref:phosphoadenosine phosphosulfate reductase family protein n=1 Tax=Luteibacter sp. 1214 TaxID=2817735 RepID=UPI0028660F0B|nr:phosphoadenosine phosphosulfate reductase family protein [Luteibacter sp. 1214]MDR6642799.1 3'-phosphoadenosine 5'-phosphosulfate sulfotransferase (PAPS reductase)/FAD synthetase [Luteibacter sp. 1214]